MGGVRWLLLKDLQILRRSPLQAVLLVAYPILIAVLVGFAISRGPEDPRVAFLNEVPPNTRINVGGAELPKANVPSFDSLLTSSSFSWCESGSVLVLHPRLPRYWSPSLTWAGVAVGRLALYRATAPVTAGAAMLVPEEYPYEPVRRVDQMHLPGAMMSTSKP